MYVRRANRPYSVVAQPMQKQAPPPPPPMATMADVTTNRSCTLGFGLLVAALIIAAVVTVPIVLTQRSSSSSDSSPTLTSNAPSSTAGVIGGNPPGSATSSLALAVTSAPPPTPLVANLLANFSASFYWDTGTSVGSQVFYWKDARFSSTMTLSLEICPACNVEATLGRPQELSSPAVTLFAANQYFYMNATNANLFPVASDYTVVVAVNTDAFDANTGDGGGCALVSGYATGRLLYMNTGTGTLQNRHSSTDVNEQHSTIALQNSTSAVVSFVWTQGASIGNYYVNGNPAGNTGTVSANNADGTLCLGGCGFGYNTCSGYYYGIALYSSALSNADRQQAEAFYSGLWVQNQV
jgi:hypothetical protein